MWRPSIPSLAVALAILGGGMPAHADLDATTPAEASSPSPTTQWCAPGLPVLSNGVCYSDPGDSDSKPSTLVIFLHGATKPDTTWQWGPQRGLANAGRAYRFTVIMPRGRTGIGPDPMQDWWVWPTGVQARQLVEAQILREWIEAKAELETQRGKPFERVFVFGFSSGAYYAASLALRAQPGIDGYGVFAGGSAPSRSSKPSPPTLRPPIYVAWGTRDPHHRDPVGFSRALARWRWKHMTGGQAGVGHTMTDRQIREAIGFLSRSTNKRQAK